MVQSVRGRSGLVSTRELYRRRLLVVAEHLRLTRDLRSETQIAAAMGIDQSYWAKIRNGEKLPDTEQIDRASSKLGLPFSYFSDPTLGDEPDVQAYIGRTRVEREDDRGTPNAEAYIAGQLAIGRPVSEEHARRLRSIRLSSGDMPVASFESAHRSWIAEEAGKVVERRGEPVAAKIDEARGQKRLEPAKKPTSRLGRR